VDDFVGALNGDVQLRGQLELQERSEGDKSTFLEFDFVESAVQDERILLSKDVSKNQYEYNAYAAKYSALLYKLSVFISNNLDRFN